MTKNLKIGYRRLPLVTGNTLVFPAKLWLDHGPSTKGSYGYHPPPLVPSKDAKWLEWPVPARVNALIWDMYCHGPGLLWRGDVMT